MEKEKSFIVPPPEKRKRPGFYLNKELLEDISVFPEALQPVIWKKAHGTPLSNREHELVSSRIDRWWQTKYGFPFNLQAARDEVLLRKYTAPEVLGGAKSLFQKLLEAVAGGGEKEIQVLKKEYQERYPDEMEGIEVLFGIREFCLKQKQFEKERSELTPEEKIKQFRDFTEYQFLFTHFILQYGGDKELLDNFWKAQAALAERCHVLNGFNILRRAQMSQVAVYKILEGLGIKPKLSHPDEDAFQAIDLWAEGDKAIQIKGWDEEVPAVAETEHLVFPSMQVDESSKKSKFFSSAEYFNNKNIQFRAKIRAYGARTQREIKGFMFVVPYSKIDFVTGEPAQELIEFFKQELAKNENR